MHIYARAAVIRKRRTVLRTSKQWELVLWLPYHEDVPRQWSSEKLVFWRETREELVTLARIFS